MIRIRKYRFAKLVMGTVAALAALTTSTAGAAQITGIADENLEQWSSATWAAFNATGVKQVRHIVPWDVAMPGNASELTEAENWVTAAEASGLKVLISFGHNNEPFPSTADYLTAVGRFRENPKFDQITEYTAWNEPNHHLGSNPEGNPDSFPHVAAGYWINLNFVCSLPKYGPACTVAAGDFLDPNGDGEALKKYINTYKQTLAESSVSPAIWAIHPYSAAETNDWSKVDSKFMALTENKPVWFTEVGGMVCRPGHTSNGTGGFAAGSLGPSEEFQRQAAANLLGGIDARPRVQRTYYYSLSGGTSTVTCPINNPGTPAHGEYKWDSALTSSNGYLRPVYRTLFPDSSRAVVAFQANTGTAWTYSSIFANKNLGTGMASGTSPSIAVKSAGGHTVAFHGSDGSLWTYSPNSGVNDLNLGMAAGTSPSIAPLPGGGYAVAFQANTGTLWIYSPGAAAFNTNLAMASGTSPSIAPISSSYRAAIHSNTGQLWTYAPSGTEKLGLGMGANTSPSIAAVGGSHRVAFQANTQTLWTYSPSGGAANTSLGMAAGTDPNIAPMAGGSYRVAIHSNTGQLWTYAPSGTEKLGLGMGAATSPTLTARTAGGHIDAFQANTGTLFTYSPSGGAINIGLGMTAGTDPRIAQE